MEADWAVEVGGDAAVIDALWPGFVDLRQFPDRIGEIEEASEHAGLAGVLLRLNGQDSPMWTAKSDLWTVVGEDLDPDEMEADRVDGVAGMACYLDLMPRERLAFGLLDDAREWATAMVKMLRTTECRRSRADLVLREAFAGEVRGYGVTAYVVGCGATIPQARDSLLHALDAFAEMLCKNPDALRISIKRYNGLAGE